MPGHGRKIIVVEDDKDINELVCYNLRKEGFEVSPVFDGEEAQRSLKAADFDIVILDIMLPGENGFSICRSIKESPRADKPKVIMLTAKNEIRDRLYAHFLGADYYITKPFSVDVLVSVVKELSKLAVKEDFKNKKRTGVA